MRSSHPTTERDSRASIAVDLGAESCRVSLLRFGDGTAHLRLVHRFANAPVQAVDGSLRWPLQQILEGVDEGVRRAAELAPEGVASIAVDGWAVDYVRLGEDGKVLEDPFCYRDERNAKAAAELHRSVAPGYLRQVTGIEQQPLNTLYQLYADRLSGKRMARWLNLPEYVLHRWGGEPVAERTNASHTQLVDLQAADWSSDIFEVAGLEPSWAARIVNPGSRLGNLRGPLAATPGLQDTHLIAPACHDTASAIAGIAETGDDWAYLSCGTWSLVGTLLDEPFNSPAVQTDNFTNLAGVGGRTLFHKGINGLWILKQCLDHWAEDGQAWEIAALLRAAELETIPSDLLHVDDPLLMGMGDMPARINQQRAAKGLDRLSEHSKDAPGMVCLLLHSLADRYAQVIRRIEAHSGKELRRIVMVGGGAQNAMLRRLTAERTGLEVRVGPAESATIGNLAVQRAVLDGSSPASGPAFAQDVVLWARRIGEAIPF